MRHPENRSQALDGWYSPDGLKHLLAADEAKAHQQLDNTEFNFGFPLRLYQQQAIRETEKRISQGQRDILLAMGCDELQGFFYARPMPADTLLAWSQGEKPAGSADFTPSVIGSLPDL